MLDEVDSIGRVGGGSARGGGVRRRAIVVVGFVIGVADEFGCSGAVIG